MGAGTGQRRYENRRRPERATASCALGDENSARRRTLPSRCNQANTNFIRNQGGSLPRTASAGTTAPGIEIHRSHADWRIPARSAAVSQSAVSIWSIITNVPCLDGCDDYRVSAIAASRTLKRTRAPIPCSPFWTAPSALPALLIIHQSLWSFRTLFCLSRVPLLRSHRSPGRLAFSQSATNAASRFPASFPLRGRRDALDAMFCCL